MVGHKSRQGRRGHRIFFPALPTFREAKVEKMSKGIAALRTDVGVCCEISIRTEARARVAPLLPAVDEIMLEEWARESSDVTIPVPIIDLIEAWHMLGGSSG